MLRFVDVSSRSASTSCSTPRYSCRISSATTTPLSPVLLFSSAPLHRRLISLGVYLLPTTTTSNGTTTPTKATTPTPHRPPPRESQLLPLMRLLQLLLLLQWECARQYNTPSTRLSSSAIYISTCTCMYEHFSADRDRYSWMSSLVITIGIHPAKPTEKHTGRSPTGGTQSSPVNHVKTTTFPQQWRHQRRASPSLHPALASKRNSPPTLLSFLAYNIYTPVRVSPTTREHGRAATADQTTNNIMKYIY